MSLQEFVSREGQSKQNDRMLTQRGRDELPYEDPNGDRSQGQ